MQLDRNGEPRLIALPKRHPQHTRIVRVRGGASEEFRQPLWGIFSRFMRVGILNSFFYGVLNFCLAAYHVGTKTTPNPPRSVGIKSWIGGIRDRTEAPCANAQSRGKIMLPKEPLPSESVSPLSASEQFHACVGVRAEVGGLSHRSR